MRAQGWYDDPFEVHDARWFSAGTPTELVRDGRVEGTDPPPAATWAGELVPAPEPDVEAGEDLRRSDDWNDHESHGGRADAFAAADFFLG